MHQRRIKHLLYASFSLILIGTVSNAFSFVDKSHVPTATQTFLVGQSHQTITQAAFEDYIRDHYGEVTEGMQTALKETAEANAKVDDNQYDSSWHVDGESFSRAQSRILDLRVQLILAIKLAKDAKLGREKLGQILHTMQDFYSHSNWVENNGISTHPQLGVKGASIAGTATPPSHTCDTTNHAILQEAGLFLLTSGYFGGEDNSPPNRSLPGAAKCFHGGPGDSLIPLSQRSAGFSPGLNKDSAISVLTTSSSLHPTAALAARQATVKFLEELQPDLTANEVALLLGADQFFIRNDNASSAVSIQLTLDLSPLAAFLSPGQSFAPSMPFLASAGEHTLEVRGLSSASFTGLIFYTLHLPAHLEFVSVTSDRFGGPSTLTGQDATALLVLTPVSGPPNRVNTYKIRVVP